MEILLVDDFEEALFVLKNLVRQLGHTTLTANDGNEAMKIMRNSNISLVITDWEMPGMNGTELIKAIRNEITSRYVYIIMLTAKGGRSEIVEGLEAGADDFIVKPFNPQELKVRVANGERILQLEKNLAEKNLILEVANEKLTAAYQQIQRDLEAAAALQQKLLPRQNAVIGNYAFDWLFLPSKFIAGDILNFYQIHENYIAFYLLDVAGHGIPSAMLSFSLSQMFTAEAAASRILTPEFRNTQSLENISIENFLSHLNTAFFKPEDTSGFFTILFGVIEISSGRVKIARAGHTLPLLIRKGGEATFIKSKGMPIGILDAVTFEEHHLELYEGDKLIIYSDGITECANGADQMFGTDGLVRFMDFYGKGEVKNLIPLLKDSLIRWKGGQEFNDDVSMLIVSR
ncbi:MAG: fused response regulator/phosphatase [Ignavibacteriales bacterium]|nr:fused response regulator/phosphatase [Ignavibacteriaceae bacterium]QOJ28202.1 MAG: fused response regulator/phosphatase [Ignavibacteriales bacterium]